MPGVAEAHRVRARGWRATSWRRAVDALQRRLDGAVQPVVGDEVAVAVPARFLEPGERAEQLVVAAPERDVVADAGRLVGDLALDLGQEFRCRRVEMAGEHEVLPDQQAELVAGLVEAGRLVAAAAPDADHVHVGVGGRLQQVAGRLRGDAAGQGVGGDPVGAAGEDGAAVDAQAEAAAGGVGLGDERDVAERDAEGAAHCRPAAMTQVVERLAPLPAGHQSAGFSSVSVATICPVPSRSATAPAARSPPIAMRQSTLSAAKPRSVAVTSRVDGAGRRGAGGCVRRRSRPRGRSARRGRRGRGAPARCSSPSRSRTAACAACCRSGSGSCRRCRGPGTAGAACSALAARVVGAEGDLDAVLAGDQRAGHVRGVLAEAGGGLAAPAGRSGGPRPRCRGRRATSRRGPGGVEEVEGRASRSSRGRRPSAGRYSLRPW